MQEQTRYSGRQPKDGEASTSGTSYFLGIGINQYLHFENLHNAVKDVKDIAALLQEKYDLEAENVELLENEAATRKNIITLLDHFQNTLTANDKLIIYYSGHGHLDKWKKGYWIPTDAELDNTAQYIRNSTLKEYIQDIPALHILLISDACFSGSLFYHGSYRSTEAVDELERHKSRWALCSRRHDQVVADGKPGGNSPFADSILYVLRRNEAPKLNVSKLTEKVLEMTRANYDQLPEGSYMQGVDHRGGQYVFRLKGVAEEALPVIEAPVKEFSAQTSRGVLAQMASESEEVRRWLYNWGLYQLVALVGLVLVGAFTTNDNLLGQLLIGFIPIVFYLAAYFPALYTELSRKNLLTLTFGYALVYYSLLLVWKINRGAAYPWWQFTIMLVVGLMLYYFVLPLLSKTTQKR